jgi:hypothetical protein
VEDFFNIPTKFSIYFTMDPKQLKNSLKISKKLQKGADWQVLKEFPFGTLGYDYEEGIKLVGTFEHLDKAIEYCSTIRKTLGLPRLRLDGFPFISFDLTGTFDTSYYKKFEEAGLVRTQLGYTFKV